MRRGEIWLADMVGGMGSEQKLIRPVVIIQNDIGNFYAPTVTIAPLTSQNKKWLPTHVTLHRTKCLATTSTVLVEQTTTISKERIIRFIGNVDPQEIRDIDNAIMIQMGLVEINKTEKIC